MTRSHACLVKPITPDRSSLREGPGHAFDSRLRALMWIAVPAFLLSPAVEPSLLAAAVTNTSPALAADLPDMGASVLRLFGSLALVLALFFGGVYLFRNWQRLALHKGTGSHLRVQEVKPLGHRQALYLVQCDRQRLLLASSPQGIQFITHVEDAREEPSAAGGESREPTPFLSALHKAEGAGS